ncbi:MAG: formate--tetrahydrofolate ligase [Oscillospiraceae bacterium]|nr:formate--tetrahydrofolate ligase [Oscillospiraceae bacterium]
MRSDIEIAQQTPLEDIRDVARGLGVGEEYLELYGKRKAKLDLSLLDKTDKPDGKLILVTAITPTPAGEGKTTTTVGLADALTRIGKKAVAALREPSLGPVFGMKGGAAGGGYAQVVPMEDINLHFTGDFHAVGAANNLLAALIDNHIHHGNALRIDPNRVTWRRCVDMNDRFLRGIVGALGGKVNGVTREDGFDITAASEIMAVLCLSDGMADLKSRLSDIVVGRSYDGGPVTAGSLGAAGAMTALLKDAIKPNLVQTLEHTPVLAHGGPFANIAHGCNTAAATRMALRLGDYAVTEAGFGADLGAEKFLDIKCRATGLRPAAVVVVATVRALKHHGGAPRQALDKPDLNALVLGLPNLLRHVDNMVNVFGLPAVVALNRFPSDSDSELELVSGRLKELNVNTVLSEVWGRGGQGGEELAREAVRLCELPSELKFAYDAGRPVADKLRDIAVRVYRAGGVTLTPAAKKQAAWLEEQGFGGLPVCVAKTQYSFSDDPKLLGAPEGFEITVRDLKVSAGARFIVAQTGEIMTMPGLPAKPAAAGIDITDDGVISGLF